MKNNCGANLSRKSERGNVLAYTVLSALFLFFAVGLGVDLSHLYSVKTELQNAADAAALAGASALLLPEEQDPINTAVDRALLVLNENKFNFNTRNFESRMTLAAQRSLVKFAVNLNDSPYMSEAAAAVTPNIRFVKVETPDVPVTIFFAIPILGTSRSLEATAISGLSVPSNVFCNISPIAVVEGAFGEGIGLLDTNGDGFKNIADCSPPEGAEACDPASNFCPGCKYKITAAPSQFDDTSAGNYQLLDAGSGANDLKYAIAGGTAMCITSTDTAEWASDTNPGRATGPVAKGFNTRFDDYSGFGAPTITINGETKTVEQAFPPDANIYQGPGPPGKGNPHYVYEGIWKSVYDSPTGPKTPPSHTAASEPRREISFPIVKFDQWDNGKDNVKYDRVGKFFLNKKVDGNEAIYAEYMGIALAGGGYDPNGGNTSTVVVPVLYK
jgi:Flp pilus assembly protein TadG